MSATEAINMNRLPILPPLRTFKVTRKNEDADEDNYTEVVVVHAHEIQFPEGGILAFIEYRIVDGVPLIQMSRIFKEWLDVEEILVVKSRLMN